LWELLPFEKFLEEAVVLLEEHVSFLENVGVDIHLEAEAVETFPERDVSSAEDGSGGGVGEVDVIGGGLGEVDVTGGGTAEADVPCLDGGEVEGSNGHPIFEKSFDADVFDELGMREVSSSFREGVAELEVGELFSCCCLLHSGWCVAEVIRRISRAKWRYFGETASRNVQK